MDVFFSSQDCILILFVVLTVFAALVLKPSSLYFDAMDKSPNSPKTHNFRNKLKKMLGSGSFKTKSNPSSPVTEKPRSMFQFESNSMDSLETG